MRRSHCIPNCGVSRFEIHESHLDMQGHSRPHRQSIIRRPRAFLGEAGGAFSDHGGGTSDRQSNALSATCLNRGESSCFPRFLRAVNVTVLDSGRSLIDELPSLCSDCGSFLAQRAGAAARRFHFVGCVRSAVHGIGMIHRRCLDSFVSAFFDSEAAAKPPARPARYVVLRAP